MSRLNASLKLLFCWGELFFVLVSLIFFAASGYVATKSVAALRFPVAIDMAKWVLLLSGAMLFCSCYGSFGAIRQTRRKGCCFTGRRMLGLHQLMLILVLFFSISQVRRSTLID